jgi:hypothetical protein
LQLGQQPVKLQVRCARDGLNLGIMHKLNEHLTSDIVRQVKEQKQQQQQQPTTFHKRGL